MSTNSSDINSCGRTINFSLENIYLQECGRFQSVTNYSDQFFFFFFCIFPRSNSASRVDALKFLSQGGAPRTPFVPSRTLQFCETHGVGYIVCITDGL